MCPCLTSNISPRDRGSTLTPSDSVSLWKWISAESALQSLMVLDIGVWVSVNLGHWLSTSSHECSVATRGGLVASAAALAAATRCARLRQDPGAIDGEVNWDSLTGHLGQKGNWRTSGKMPVVLRSCSYTNDTKALSLTLSSTATPCEQSGTLSTARSLWMVPSG